MFRAIALALALALTAPAVTMAQTTYPPAPDLSGYATTVALANGLAGKADTAALAAKVDASAIPSLVLNNLPFSNTAPPMENPTAAAGVTATIRRGDAVTPRITRMGDTTTDATGNWSITWSTPLPTAPGVMPVPINSGTQPMSCTVATRTTTGATGRCWLSRTLPSALTLITALISYDIFGAPANGMTVQVFAIPKTQ